MPRWSKLARPITTLDGTTLRTYDDAARYVSRKLPTKRNAWIHAAQLLTQGGTAEQVTRQIERALFLEALWLPLAPL